MRSGLFLSILFFFSQLNGALATPTNADLHDNDFDIKVVSDELTKNGLEGSVHGSAEELGLYVFTYRHPKGFYPPGDMRAFFNHLEISLYARTPELKKQLAGLNRHDKVKIKGTLSENGGQPHIKVSEITVIEKFTDAERAKHGAYTHNTVVADAIKGKTEIEAVVHAVAREGKILVFEYGDAVIPVSLTKSDLTEKLSRGDKVKIHFKKQAYPRRPTHLELDETVKTPIEHLDNLLDQNGKDADSKAEGELILFPKSPQINIPVYAIRFTDTNGTSRNFTVLNPDPDVFEKVRDRCTEVWKKYEADIQQGRNYLVNPKIRVKATGKINMVDRSQANPQIYVDKVGDLEFTYNGVVVP